MATWTIKGHNRGGTKRKAHQVKTYEQNRRDGKPRGKGSKPYTACQNDIAEVINRNLAFNATPETLRSESAWRHYVCNCKNSNVYDIATTGVAGPNSWFRHNPVKGADYTYTDSKGRKRTIKGIVAHYKSFEAYSTCGGIYITVPAFSRPLSGKEIINLKRGA